MCYSLVPVLFPINTTVQLLSVLFLLRIPILSIDKCCIYCCTEGCDHNRDVLVSRILPPFAG